MKSAGENRLAAALEKALKPPWAIYRNVAWLEKRPGAEPADGEADIVLAHPDRGVMVIEVKGGRVQRIGGGWESVDGSGKANRIKDPFAQVTGEMHGLRRVCEGMPSWPLGRVRFARAVGLPDCAYDRSMTPDGPREIVIDGDDLARVGQRVEEIFDWWSRLGRRIGGGWCARRAVEWARSMSCSLATSRSRRRSRLVWRATRRRSSRSPSGSSRSSMRSTRSGGR